MLCVWGVSLCLILGSVGATDDIDIGKGIQFVDTNDEQDTPRFGDSSIIDRFRQFFSNHQVQIKFDDIFPATNEIERSLKGALDYLNGLEADEDESGRKGGGGLGGGKKGGGAILAMATMMGGTMAALGFGAVGMLAMKALTVSAMALMLSAVIGLKKLLSKDEGDNGHSVSYIPVHHGGGHRRRREAPHLAYGAYVPLIKL